MLKICLLSSMHPPLDKRVFDKEARTLAAAGHEVVHLCPDESARQWEQDGVRLETYPTPSGWFGRLLQLPRLYFRAAKVAADCYHCNEVDSWVIGVGLKWTRGARVVFDVHEHYPSTFSERAAPRWLQPLLAAAIRTLFWLLAWFTDRLVLAKRTVADDFRGFEEKQVLVQNFTPRAAAASATHTADGPVTAIHLGLFSRARGWPQLLEALERCPTSDLRAHVVGTFNDGTRDAFDREAQRRGLNERIQVESWMPFGEAYQRIAAAQIGLILFLPGVQNHVFALPHKMFDYMRAGLPLIAPHFAVEVAEIIQRSDCGLLVDTSNPQEIADALEQLATDSELRQRLGDNGRQAVLREYHWEAEAEKLLAMYAEWEGVRKPAIPAPAESAPAESAPAESAPAERRHAA